jgi:tetratricopeptide (TPR) repeat protein
MTSIASTPRRGFQLRGGRVTSVALLAWLASAGCNFEVTNPGLLQDAALDDRGAHLALVTGAERAVAAGLTSFAHPGAASAREVQASGSTGHAGITLFEELGQLDPGKDGGGGGGFGNMHQARWIAEEAIERMEAALGAQAENYELLGRAYMWAGFANRILGENMCHAVYNGGGPEAFTTHFDRAISQFTRAIEIGRRVGGTAGQNIERAALAGRAAAYLYIGKNAEAEADASAVPLAFVHGVQYYNSPSPVYTLAQALYDSSVRGISTWNTHFDEYYTQTGDPRAAWGFDTTKRFGENKRVTYGDVLFHYPLKFYRVIRTPNIYTQHIAPLPANRALMENQPVNLTTGREMQLVLAEVKLRRGDWQGAMTNINSLRSSLRNEITNAPLSLWTATNAEQAWAHLKRERAIELWMEGRRMGDLRRWRAANTPGALHPLEYVPQELVSRFPDVKREQDVCFPIPRAERETNPNVPLDFGR